MSRTADGEPGVLEARLWQRLEQERARLHLELSDELEAELRRWVRRASRDRELRRNPEAAEIALDQLIESLAERNQPRRGARRRANLAQLRQVLQASLGHRSHPVWARLSVPDDLVPLVQQGGFPVILQTSKSTQVVREPILANVDDVFEPSGHGTVSFDTALELPAEAGAEVLPSSPDPPRKAFALLSAPPAAVEGVELEVMVGLAEKPQPGVVGGALERPASSVGPYTLVVQLVAEGFTLRAGESSRRELLVTAEAPYPAAVFHLTAQADSSAIEARVLQALFSVDGQTIGAAFRAIAVVASAEQLEGRVAEPQEGLDLQVPTAEGAPDLTVRILAPSSTGRLHWSFETPHSGIEVPESAIETDLGDDAKVFARTVVDQVNLMEGQDGLRELLLGIGETVSEKVPPALWELLRAVAAKAQGPPAVLLLSQEPFVPWELAVLPEPPLLAGGVPPHLGAQAVLGRWVLGSLKPSPVPPVQVEVERLDVVFGLYDRVPGFRRLVEAEKEAAEIQEAAFLGGVRRRPVDATSAAVLSALREQSEPADVLHFAVHGMYDPDGLQDGLMLIDRRTLPPLVVKGSSLAGAPFVYLNACQVGAGNRVLGSPAGLAEAFLHAGASAVIAPCGRSRTRWRARWRSSSIAEPLRGKPRRP